MRAGVLVEMCGIAGFLRTSQTPDREQHRHWLEQMGLAIVHRGPDAGAVYIDDHVGLSHRRLSILDLSDAGTQPMPSASGRHLIAFNGEIYNYRMLRQELEAQGHRFRTQTDTEVFVTLFEQQGLDCVHKLNGMFAAAIWDTQTRRLFLIRDRLGKKPLYYYHHNGQFAFASEIKALHAAPFVKTTIRYDAIKDFFFYQYIPDPKSIYREVHKLPPGHWLVVDDNRLEVQRYWDISFGRVEAGSEAQFAEGLREKLDEAVRLRMISDVPLGAFLSGGVDSSAVVALMARESSSPVTTCAIGFDSKRFDEVQYARRVAELFHTDHHEFTVKASVTDNLRSIARFFDEPFADPSFVPTYFVSQLARQQVTVALAGDGGDENFAGYTKYHTDAVENRLRATFPSLVRQKLFPPLAGALSQFPFRQTRRATSLLNTLALDPATAFYVSNRFCSPLVWERIAKGRLAAETHDYNPADITRGHYHHADTDDHLSKILYTDFKTYLPGDVMVKVDRMSMANSLETRAPLLDYRVVEYVAAMPSSFKLHGSEKKFILKKAFEDVLPKYILYRKKMGFSVPLANWLRGEVKEIANRMFSSESGELSIFFDMSKVNSMWCEHLNGNNKYTQELWTLLVFGLWADSYLI